MRGAGGSNGRRGQLGGVGRKDQLQKGLWGNGWQAGQAQRCTTVPRHALGLTYNTHARGDTSDAYHLFPGQAEAVLGGSCHCTQQQKGQPHYCTPHCFSDFPKQCCPFVFRPPNDGRQLLQIDYERATNTHTPRRPANAWLPDTTNGREARGGEARPRSAQSPPRTPAATPPPQKLHSDPATATCDPAPSPAPAQSC